MVTISLSNTKNQLYFRPIAKPILTPEHISIQPERNIPKCSIAKLTQTQFFWMPPVKSNTGSSQQLLSGPSLVLLPQPHCSATAHAGAPLPMGHLTGAPGSSPSSPVIPVKEQPVHSFQLIFPQLVAVLILPGLLQFLPGLGCWALLGRESRNKIHGDEKTTARCGQATL